MIGNGGRPGDPGPGSVDINKWGENADIDIADANGTTTSQIIWPIKSTVQAYLFLDAAIELFVKSTSVNDDVDAGSGARTLRMLVHDPSGEEQEIIQDLQGTANQSLGLSFGVFRIELETTGDSDTNEGQIQVVDGSANIYATIEIGEGQTQIAVQRCPDNKKCKVKRHETGYGRTGGNNEASMRLRLRKTDGTIITKWDPIVSVDHPKDIKDYGIGGIELNAGEFIFWECILVSADNTPIKGAFDIRSEDL